MLPIDILAGKLRPVESGGILTQIKEKDKGIFIIMVNIPLGMGIKKPPEGVI
jgi:hypothetical protein